MKINIIEICDKKTITRDDGEKINEILSKKWNRVVTFDIDFSNVLVASVSFMDAAFGRLALRYSKEDLQKKLKFRNILDFDRGLLNDILLSRLRQNNLAKDGSSVGNN